MVRMSWFLKYGLKKSCLIGIITGIIIIISQNTLKNTCKNKNLKTKSGLVVFNIKIYVVTKINLF